MTERLAGAPLPRRARPPHRGGRRAGPRRRRRGGRARGDVRHLRHRPARVHRRADRHAGRAAPAHRRAEPADPRPRVRGRRRRGRAGRDTRRRGRPRRDHAARLLRPLRATAGAGCSTCARPWAASGSRIAWGGMAELATVAEYQVVPPPGRRDLPAGRADRADRRRRVRRRARAASGRATACSITGAGPIGALAALCARAAGASDGLRLGAEPRATGAGRGARRRDGARPDVRSTCRRYLREQSDGLGVDVAIECSGHPTRLRRRRSLAAPARHARPDRAVRRRGSPSSRCSGRSTT